MTACSNFHSFIMHGLCSQRTIRKWWFSFHIATPKIKYFMCMCNVYIIIYLIFIHATRLDIVKKNEQWKTNAFAQRAKTNLSRVILMNLEYVVALETNFCWIINFQTTATTENDNKNSLIVRFGVERKCIFFLSIF